MRFYIDPGTGSMLFTIVIAVLGSLVYLLRNLKLKIGSLIRRDRKAEHAQATPLVIFSDHKRYWTTFAPICDELEKRGQPTLYLSESQDDPVFQRNYQHIHAEYIGEGNSAFARLNFLRARVMLSTTPSLDVYQWKRSRDVSWYVHIPHAPNDITLYRMFGIDYYDAILLSGEYQVEQVRKLEKLRGLPEKELKLVGIPYMDEMKKRLDAAPAKQQGSMRTVLLAPSWGDSGILKRYGTAILDALLKTGYHIIIRPHPQSYTSEKEMLDTLKAAYPDSDQLEWNRDNDNFDVLSRSDILISDFSGVIFDFTLVFDKPVLYADTSFDKGPYDAWWLNEELWTFEILPKLGMHISEQSLPELKEIIDQCIENPAYQEARDQARRETWCHIGAGAEKTVDYLMETLDRLSTVKDEKKDDPSSKKA